MVRLGRGWGRATPWTLCFSMHANISPEGLMFQGNASKTLQPSIGTRKELGTFTKRILLQLHYRGMQPLQSLDGCTDQACGSWWKG